MFSKNCKPISVRIALVLVLIAGVFSVIPAQAESSVVLEWAKSMGGVSGDDGLSISVDESGNVYTTGTFSDTVDFDPGTGTSNLTSGGGSDIFISKLDSSGNFIWAKSMGGIAYDAGTGIAVDNSGNVYTTGIFRATVDFDPGIGTSNLSSMGDGDIFISKLDGNGNFVWARSMGGIAGDMGVNITIDDSGNVYTTGTFYDTADFDPGIGTSILTSEGESDIFVSKLDGNGNFVWAKSMGGIAFDFGAGIAVNDSGNVYTTGAFYDTVDFDPGVGASTLTSGGGDDIFISKLDGNGNFVWARSMGGTFGDSGRSIAINNNGNVYTTGSFEAMVDFDPGVGASTLTSEGARDIFISKLDGNGNFVWAKSMGGISNDDGVDIAVDESGNVYAIGTFYETVDFDPGSGTNNLTSEGDRDIFNSKLDSNGDFVWAKSMGGISYDDGAGISADNGGNVYTTGYFREIVDFDPGEGISNLTSAGANDIFVSKLIAIHKVLYVDQGAIGANNGTSWTDAYTDLQSALSAASNGDEIWVAAGTYYPTSGTDRAISFELKNGVKIYGGFAGTETLRTQRDFETNVTVLSGDLNGDDNDNIDVSEATRTDNSYHIVVGSGTSNTAILDGFTITAGNANSGDHFRGGGMYNNKGSPSVQNVIFSGNSGGLGGGMNNNYEFPETDPPIGSNPILTNVTFINNSAFQGGGMFNSEYGSPSLTNVTFIGNTADSYGGGLLNHNYTSPNLINVTFVGNTADFGGGMSDDSAGYSSLTNVTFSENIATVSGGGIDLSYKAGSSTYKNILLWGNSAPTGSQIYDGTSTPDVSDSVIQGGYAGGTNIITTDPILGALGNYGGFTQTMALQAGSSAIDMGDDGVCPPTDQRGVARPQGSHCDIGAYESDLVLHYVKSNATGADDGTSWADAYTDLQSALSAASGDDEIWVAAGTYYPTPGTDRAISFELKNGVAIYGGFAGIETLRTQRDFAMNLTVLSGDIGVSDIPSDNSYHVVVGNNTGNTAVLDGFTITAGNASGASPLNNGGGIYNSSGDPTLTNLIFDNNSADGGGGGVFNADSNPSLTNVTISSNSASWGGGIYNWNGSNPSVMNVTINGNSASYAGGMLNESNSSPNLVNATFTENIASSYGGGMLNRTNSNPSLTNVTISGNSASIEGGGIANDGSNLIIKNSILWGNTGGEIQNINFGDAVVTNGIVQGGYPGTGNLNVDPLLGPLQDNGGFTQTMALSVGSPAIDTGTNTGCPDTDQRGVTRPQGSQCDIGAYEVDSFTKNLKSIATQDGWVLETSETSGQGGTLNNTGTVLYVGDNGQDKQYRSILSFNTMGLPDNAVITSVKLRIRVQGFVGDNMFTPTKTHGNLLMDINGLYFGANANLAVNDFQSAVGLNGLNAAGVLTSAPTTGWYTVNLKSAAYDFVNLMGKTQFRLRFQTDDNDDNGADYLKIFSGNAPAANRPQLIVEYYVP